MSDDTVLDVREIPLDQIVEDPDNVRLESGDPEVDNLAANMLANGLLQPIVVYPIGRDGHYRISGGHRRYRAAQQLEWTSIPAAIIEAPATTLKRLDLMAAENLQRKQLNAIERALLYKRYIDKGLMQKDVAERLNISQSMISMELRFLDLPPDIQEKLRRREISYAEASKLAVREKNERAARPHGTYGRKKSSGLAAPHFNSHHPLSEKAKDLCLASAHPTYLHIAGACGPCWESVIRIDALSDSPTGAPIVPPMVRHFADPREMFALVRCERCGLGALERAAPCFVVVHDGTSTRRKIASGHSFPLPVQVAPATPEESSPFPLASAFTAYRLAVEAGRSALRMGRAEDALAALDEAALPRLKPTASKRESVLADAEVVNA